MLTTWPHCITRPQWDYIISIVALLNEGSVHTILCYEHVIIMQDHVRYFSELSHTTDPCATPDKTNTVQQVLSWVFIDYYRLDISRTNITLEFRQYDAEKGKTEFTFLNSQTTPYTSPLWASYGFLLSRWRTATATYRECTMFKQREYIKDVRPVQPVFIVRVECNKIGRCNGLATIGGKQFSKSM